MVAKVAITIAATVTRKFPVNSNGIMERLMCNFHYLSYYCSPNLSIHQNSTQEPTWNFLVTFASFDEKLLLKRSNSVLPEREIQEVFY